MTQQNETKPMDQNLLERILETVESIDKNVETMLDQLSDHLEDVRYHSWYDDEDDESSHCH